MAETAVQYFTRICKEAGKSDADVAALLVVVQDAKVSSHFDETIRRGTDDFNAMQGRVTAAEKKVKTYDEDWYPKANAEYTAMQTENNRLRTLVNGNPDDPPGFDSSKYLTKADLEAMNKERDARYAQVIKQAARLASRHVSKFGEELDVDAVEKLAIEKNLPLDMAYKEFIAPRELEAQTAKFTKEKEEAVREGIRNYASQHKLPVDPVPHETAPVYRQRPETKVDIDSELINAWNSAGSK